VVLTTPTGSFAPFLRASDRLDFAKSWEILGTKDVELATEAVLPAYPEFELGAVPPTGGTATASS
jgi:prolyl-tRNA editing enzyme YbaK/EbsC (Cys-tRNA(Pro) deacylase)